MQLLMAWTYFSSALIKLRVAGLKYLSADNLPALAIFHSLDNLHDTHFQLAFWLPQVKAYLPFAVGLVLIWELLFPLAVFWRRCALVDSRLRDNFSPRDTVFHEHFLSSPARDVLDFRRLGPLEDWSKSRIKRSSREVT